MAAAAGAGATATATAADAKAPAAATAPAAAPFKMLPLTTTGRCDYEDCETGKTALRYCGTCLVAAYCSSECQNAAKREHTEYCAISSALVAQYKADVKNPKWWHNAAVCSAWVWPSEWPAVSGNAKKAAAAHQERVMMMAFAGAEALQLVAAALNNTGAGGGVSLPLLMALHKQIAKVAVGHNKKELTALDVHHVRTKPRLVLPPALTDTDVKRLLAPAEKKVLEKVVGRVALNNSGKPIELTADEHSVVSKLHGFLAPDRKDIAPQAEALFKVVNPLLQGSNPLEAIATLCVELGKLQVFEEGNGRVVRCLANALLVLRAKRPPVLFDEPTYLAALRSATPVASVQALLTPATASALPDPKPLQPLPNAPPLPPILHSSVSALYQYYVK